MRNRRQLLAHVLLIGTLAAASGMVRPGAHELELSGAIRQMHDPVLAQHDGRFYLFSTGSGISIRRSDDLLHWEHAGQAFIRRPSWARPYLPSAAAAIWAPDISRFSGQYHLYYSVSTFGSNVSAIGLATNPTLDPDDPAYAWTDRGTVIASQAGDDWNAIDPNIIVTPGGEVWLSFGSFWGGIKMVRIDAATGLRDASDETLYALASRPDPPRAVEAPFIVHRGDHYYLFVSFDMCCRGVDSTYNIRVGRSREVTGPYLDRDGTPMLAGGGTLLVGPSERWPGSGHNAVVRLADRDLLVYHGYDATYFGADTLRIEVLDWDDDGWPVSVNAP